MKKVIFNIIHNIFTEEQRNKIIDDVQPFLGDGSTVSSFYSKDGNECEYPEGFEWFNLTHATLHLLSEFEWAHKILLSRINEELDSNLYTHKSWINESNGRNRTRKWHNHDEGPSDYSAVYYLKTNRFFDSGTLFKEYGFVKVPQNSVLVFPPHLDHTTPSSLFRFKRYSWVLDLISKTKDT